MSGKKLGGFSTFDGATPPVSPAAREETPVEPPSAKPAVVRQARPARTARAAEVPAELSASQERWILHGVRAALGKVAAERARLDEAKEALGRELADARAKGIDERKLLGAALSAGVDLPDAE